MLQIILMAGMCGRLSKHTFGLKINIFLFSWAGAIHGFRFNPLNFQCSEFNL